MITSKMVGKYASDWQAASLLRVLTGIALLFILLVGILNSKTAVSQSASTQMKYFSDSLQSLGESPSWDVALGDLDSDGDLDAFVANGAGLVTDKPDNVWINDGKGNFATGKGLGTSTSYAVALGDLNGDGSLDAYVGTSGYEDSDHIWLNDGTAQFTEGSQVLSNTSTTSVALGDVNGNGILDAVTVDSWGNGNRVWLNDGSALFSDNGQRLGNFYTNSVALGDVDGDGDLDAYFANASFQNSIGRNQLWLNNGLGIFFDSGQLMGTADSQGVALADLDGDGDLDAFVANRTANRVWFNSNGVFSQGEQALGEWNSTAVALADIDLDGDIDAVVANETAESRLWLNDGSGQFSEAQGLSPFNNQGVALGDLNLDGTPDIFFANRYYCDFVCGGFPNEVWLNQLRFSYLTLIFKQ